MQWVPAMMWALRDLAYFMAGLIPLRPFPDVLRSPLLVQRYSFSCYSDFDFGTIGCTGPDGRVRRGKIITEYTNRLIYPGAIATTTFDGFYVDAVHVEGTHKITNISDSRSLLPTLPGKFKVEVINGKLTKPNGNYIEWNSTKTITQVEGLATPDYPRDDAFKIEGSAKGLGKKR